MRMTVLKRFHDKDDFSIVYNEGQVVEFEKERADRLLQLGLAAETVEEEAQEEPVLDTEVVKEAEKTEENPEETPSVAEEVADATEEVAEVAEEETPKEEVAEEPTLVLVTEEAEKPRKRGKK